VSNGWEKGGYEPPFSYPRYTKQHSGTAVVCGFGNGLLADLYTALQMREDADLIAVNEAGSMVHAQHLFSKNGRVD
jgi:hypothetical protein